MKQNDFDFEDQKAPGGYISDDHKRKFTITTGILGAFFFIAQFIAPFIIMIAYMPFMVFSGDSWLKVTKPERSALWGDSIWYVESSISTGPSSNHRSKANRRHMGTLFSIQEEYGNGYRGIVIP